ncbi:MAG: peptidoglycan DD-metalloendopeptidase family protein [Ruminococcus sp.]|nr:peptidoglycan DD-metalloendopeptidase family protein [Ruminococcus sp.]
MKKKFSRLIAVLLSLLCLLTALPGGLSLEAEAAVSYVFPVRGGGISSSYGWRTLKGKKNLHSGIDITAKGGDKIIYAAYSGTVEAVANECSHKDWYDSHGESDCGHYNTFGNYIMIRQTDGKYAYYGHLLRNTMLVKVGDKVTAGQPIATMGSSGASTGTHLHFELRNKGKSLSSGAKSYNTNTSAISYKYSGYKNDFSITSVTPSSTTNTSATFVAKLSQKAPIEKWTYLLSTDKKAINNVDGTKGSTHKTTGSIDCKRVLDYTSSPKVKTADTFTISKYQGKNLVPNTTYYYRLTVMIGGKWYQTGVMSFKTGSSKPGEPVLRIAKDNDVLGIGDQATVLWDGVTGADSYTLTVTDEAQNVVQTKKNVTGTTCVLDGFAAAGIYQITIAAVNGAGSTTGNTVSITVNPNVNVTFYDTISESNIAVVSVPYGHGANAPKNPVHDGHTFFKWDSAFDKVTSDITVNTVYDRNSYTVKFFDSFTNELLKTQTVKYQDAASAPNVTAPDGYALTGWDKTFESVTSDLNVYTVYAWTDADHSAAASIDSVVRNTTERGYDVTVTVINHINEISSGRLVVALKSAEGVILTTMESNAFAIDATTDAAEPESKQISVTVLYPELASNIEVYVINDYDTMGKLSKTAAAEIDNSTDTGWSDWIAYTGDTPPMTESDTLIVETDVIESTTPTRYRYQTKDTVTSYDTSMTGYTQDGYTLVKNSTGTVSYVASWPSGFYTGNALYKKYNVKPMSASESATQKVVIDSTVTESYLYWHWCQGVELEKLYNRTISFSKTSKYDTFHCFNHTTNATTYTDSAYKFDGVSACKETYWWGKIPVKKQTYTVYNKLYNYYKLSEYSGWIEYEGTVPVADGDSAGTNKTYINVETDPNGGQTITTKYYRYMTKSNPVIEEPAVDAAQIVDLSGNVGAEFAGKDVTIWVYKYAQASDYTTEFAATTTVAEDGSVNIANAVLREAPTVTSGDYTIIASVDGQARAVQIGTIEAPKPQYTVTFYDFDQSVISTQTVTEGGNAELPDASKLNVPEGNRFTNWSESVVNVKSNMNVYPESETETYTVAIVNWEIQTVELKKFNHGAELIIDSVPEGRKGYVTEWVVQDGEEYVTVAEFTEAGKTVTGDMVVVTRSTPEQHIVTILDADKKENIDEKIQGSVDTENFTVAVTETITSGDHIDFSEVQTTIEESEDLIFMGWINMETGEPIVDTTVTESITIYPSYSFAETTVVPEADIATGEYTSAQTVTLTTPTENAVIWYTTDGTDPMKSETAAEYTGPITIRESCYLRYYATALGHNDSEENGEFYAINAEGNAVYHVVTIEIGNVEEVENVTEAGVWLVQDGTMLPEDICPVMEGHDFIGVFFDAEYSEQFFFDVESINATMTLYAKYAPLNYTVTFVDHDGTELSKATAEYQTAAAAPEAPVREGYVFVGWDTEFDSVTSDMTVTAKYVPEDDYATIRLNRSRAIVLNENASFPHLKAIIEPAIHTDYEVVWTSSDESVAIVNEEGVITAVSVGTATITATLPYTGASVSCEVEVNANPDTAIVLKSSAVIGMDENRNVRGVKSGTNTVAELLEQFENESLVCYTSEDVALTDADLVPTGATIRLYEEEELVDSVNVVVTGDFNCDGAFNNKDIVMANQYVLEKRTADEMQMLAADVNGDGLVNNRDCSMLSRYSVGKETL